MKQKDTFALRRTATILGGLCAVLAVAGIIALVAVHRAPPKPVLGSGDTTASAVSMAMPEVPPGSPVVTQPAPPGQAVPVAPAAETTPVDVAPAATAQADGPSQPATIQPQATPAPPLTVAPATPRRVRRQPVHSDSVAPADAQPVPAYSGSRDSSAAPQRSKPASPDQAKPATPPAKPDSSGGGAANPQN